MQLLQHRANLPGLFHRSMFPTSSAKTIDLFIENSIDIPRIVVVPKGEVTAGYRDFNLDLKGVQLQPVAKDILIAHLNDHLQYRLISGDGIVPEERAGGLSSPRFGRFRRCEL